MCDVCDADDGNLTRVEKAVWHAWKALPDDEPNPVHVIAAALGMARADVAFIVLPADVFGPWDDDAGLSHFGATARCGATLRDGRLCRLAAGHTREHANYSETD